MWLREGLGSLVLSSRDLSKALITILSPLNYGSPVAQGTSGFMFE